MTLILRGNCFVSVISKDTITYVLYWDITLISQRLNLFIPLSSSYGWWISLCREHIVFVRHFSNTLFSVYFANYILALIVNDYAGEFG